MDGFGQKIEHLQNWLEKKYVSLLNNNLGITIWGVFDYSGFDGIGPGGQNMDILLKTASRNLIKNRFFFEGWGEGVRRIQNRRCQINQTRIARVVKHLEAVDIHKKEGKAAPPDK